MTVTTDNVPSPRRRGAKKIAEFLSGVLDEPVTEDMVFYWSASGKIRTGKFGHNLTAVPDELIEDVSGKAAA
jgi:hypothetical protein